MAFARFRTEWRTEWKSTYEMDALARICAISEAVKSLIGRGAATCTGRRRATFRFSGHRRNLRRGFAWVADRAEIGRLRTGLERDRARCFISNNRTDHPQMTAARHLQGCARAKIALRKWTGQLLVGYRVLYVRMRHGQN